MKIALWVFPESDFTAWQELVGENATGTYRDYLNYVTAVQADQERQGHETVRVKFTVADMKAELKKRGWENTPDKRAAITALKA